MKCPAVVRACVGGTFDGRSPALQGRSWWLPHRRVQRARQPPAPDRRGRRQARAVARHAGLRASGVAQRLNARTNAHGQAVRAPLPRACARTRRARSATRFATCCSTASITTPRRLGQVSGSIPWSSAAWFDGWAQPCAPTRRGSASSSRWHQPTAPAQTWLLAADWKRHGLLRSTSVRVSAALRERRPRPAGASARGIGAMARGWRRHRWSACEAANHATDPRRITYPHPASATLRAAITRSLPPMCQIAAVQRNWDDYHD